MEIYSFGCSFVYGNDLADCPHGVGAANPPPSNLTWPALLAKRLGAKYTCLARPAASNLQILETALSAIDQAAPGDLFVINWTWIERFGYFDEEVKKQNGPNWNPHGWASIMPSDSNNVSETYYKFIHSQLKDKLESLIYIDSAINNLQKSNLKFFMTYTDDLIWETQWHTTPAVVSLQERIKDHVNGFKGMGFVDWAKSSGFPISDKMHPLEQAHTMALDYFFDDIKILL